MGFQNNAKRIITIPLQGGGGLNPTSGSIYHISNAGVSTNNPAIRCEPMEYNGIIKNIDAIWHCSGTGGSAEIINAYIRINNTTDILFASVGTSGQIKVFRNNNANIPIAISDYFNIKFVCPTWVTAPATVYISGLIWIETT